MEYEVYKKKVGIQDYFNKFDNKEEINIELQTILYDRYLLKYNVFNRDNFTCQNKNCKYCNNKKDSPKLTLHHVKHKYHGGEDDENNCITLCKYSHEAYHNGRIDLIVNTNKMLPKEISGKVFKVSFRDKVLSKERKKAMKTLRKQLGVNIKSNYLTWEQVSILLRFLELECR